MKVLYAIQATGNGHISRAKVLIPILCKCSSVDILLSGTSSDIDLGLPITYRLKGVSFVFGKNGGINILKTLLRFNIFRFLREVFSLPLANYDLVINDFEPVSAWASKIRDKQCIALSHQYSLLHPAVPLPKKRALFSKIILKYYAPAKKGYGFHFDTYGEHIFLPIIKEEIKNLKPLSKNYFVVYLPSYSDEKIIGVLSAIPRANWVVFSKHSTENKHIGNVRIKPIASKAFNDFLLHTRGVLCGAGFETPAEAIYLKKKLLVIPMHNQYEQLCNAHALEQLGVPVLPALNQSAVDVIRKWMQSENKVNLDYSEDPNNLIPQIFVNFRQDSAQSKNLSQQTPLS